MSHLRLRTQLFIATLLLITGLTGASLLIIRHMVRSEIERQVASGIAGSVQAFKSVEQERELQLSRSVAMLAELPTLKALMTTDHGPTIQDASERFWRLSGSDLLVLANPAGRILAYHMLNPGWSRDAVIGNLARTAGAKNGTAWWYGNDRLFWVVAQPLTAGSGEEAMQLGVIAAGYEVDSSVAERLARVTGSHIALAADGKLIASTLPASSTSALRDWVGRARAGSETGPRETAIGGDRYEIASVALQSESHVPIQCYVLMPLQRTVSFMHRLNLTILILAAAAILVAAVLFTVISGAITRPLESLVAGVRALAGGDYSYSITPRGSSEVVVLGRAFANMRERLQESQQKLLEAERIATLGRTASSISHDLRHYLAGVVANAEFLYEADSLKMNRDEIFQEIKLASAQMTDLIDSLRELAREQGALSVSPGDLQTIVQRAIEAVRSRQEFRAHDIALRATGETDGTFDAKKLERVFFNLVLNACEASGANGHVAITVDSAPQAFAVRISDDGPGVPAAIRDTLFEPFVSSGKANGTGLGLAIANKIVHDHQGSIAVEETSAAGTVFLIRIPRHCRVSSSYSNWLATAPEIS